MGKYKVIYLTGAPATGKSSLTKIIKRELPDSIIFEYGKELTNLINEESKSSFKQENIRNLSSKIITYELINKLDQFLINLVKEVRETTHIIIDSHPVTKEKYGFRVSAFSIDLLHKLSPTDIFVLYAENKEILNRIQKDASGRPLISEFDAGIHTQLQNIVALNYALQLGVPIHFFDSTVTHKELEKNVLQTITGENS